ncbi:cyclodeaminase/cyclohydrolase family protein [Haloplanus sp.]|uniref:cyclodeaminase/cyclohydrolase family protein n=1 Tax=Haloplanus sp. TaxID=1961696 RepID=UPI0026057738|nr:cyclodeaminase/cyclohydrolase family protein [Haloplanus sp.]
MTYAADSIDDFLSAVASGAAVPAGGTTAAIVGATGAALCEMAHLHSSDAADADTDTAAETGTTGADLPSIRDDLRWYRGRLLTLADADADAVATLLATQPTDDVSATPEAKRATGVPLAIAEACSAVLDHAPVVTEAGSPVVVPDAVTGAFLARAAVRAAVFTVRHNADRSATPAFADQMVRRAAAVERDAERACERVIAAADARH